MRHDISSSDGLDQCFANLKRDTIALPTMEGLCVRKYGERKESL